MTLATPCGVGEKATVQALYLLALPDQRRLLMRGAFSDPAEIALAYPGARCEAGPLDVAQMLEWMRRTFGEAAARWPFSFEAIQRLVQDDHHALLAPAGRRRDAFVQAQPAGFRVAVAVLIGLLGFAALIPLITGTPPMPAVVPLAGVLGIVVAVFVALFGTRVVVDGAKDTVLRERGIFGVPWLRSELRVDRGATVLLQKKVEYLSTSAPSRPSTFAIVTVIAATGELKVAAQCLDGAQPERERRWAAALGIALEVAARLGLPVRWAGPGSAVAGRETWLFPLLDGLR